MLEGQIVGAIANGSVSWRDLWKFHGECMVWKNCTEGLTFIPNKHLLILSSHELCEVSS